MKILVARILVGLVLVINVDCAVSFLTAPGSFSPGFELQGLVGEAVIRGYGVLFLMWNVPYMFAMWNPKKNRLSLIQAVIMQVVGLAGETLIYLSLPIIHAAVRGSTLRFIIFDGAGLVVLLVALGLMLFGKSHTSSIQPRPIDQPVM